MKTVREFIADIQKKSQNIFVLDGEERFRKLEAVKFALDRILDPDMRLLNLQRMQYPSTRELIEAALRFPFMSDKRVVLVDGFALLESIKGKGGGTKDAEDFIHFVKEVPDTSLVILLLNGKLDKRKKASSAVVEFCYAFDTFKEEEALPWLSSKAKQAGKSLDKPTALRLIEAIGLDAGVLKNEMDKLIAYTGEEEQITEEAVERLASKSVSFSVFQLGEELLVGQIKKALLILQNLINNGENEYMIFAMLLRECRLNYYYKALQIERKNPADIAKLTESNPYGVSKRLPKLAKLSLTKLMDAYRYALDTDLAMKEGRISQEGLTQRALVGIYTVLYIE